MGGDGPSNLSKMSAPTTPGDTFSKELTGGSRVGSSQNSPRQGSLALTRASQEATLEEGRTSCTSQVQSHLARAPSPADVHRRSLSPRKMIRKGKPWRSESPTHPTAGQLKLKEPVTLISRWLFNESPRENIFAIKTVGADFFKSPTEGNYKIIGRKTPHGYEKKLIPWLDRDDLEPDESIFSTPASGMRHR
jgi:hypothetical protein